MVLPTFLPVVDDTSTTSFADTLASLTRIGPLLVPAAHWPAVRSALEKQEFGAQAELFLDVSEDAGADLAKSVRQAARVIVSRTQLDSVPSTVEPSQLLLRILADDLADIPNDVLQSVGGAVVVSRKDLRAAAVDLRTLRGRLPAPGLLFDAVTPEEDLSIDAVVAGYKAEIPLGVPISRLALEDSKPGLPLIKAFLAPLTSDRPDGLFPTIVTALPFHTSLGLVYSSRESLAETIRTGQAVYRSRKATDGALWRKGATSGATQAVRRVWIDCDADAVEVEAVQKEGTGFCHTGASSCFQDVMPGAAASERGVRGLERTLRERLPPNDPPKGSYTARLLADPKLLAAKILEEANELVDAQSKEETAFEMADVVYFGMVKCLQAGVTWADVERALDEKAAKGRKGERRQGDAKEKFAKAAESKSIGGQKVKKESTADAPTPATFPTAPVNGAAAAAASGPAIRMRTSSLASLDRTSRNALLKRPVMDSSAMMARVQPIIDKVREGGDVALRGLTAQFDKVEQESNVLFPPFYRRGSPEELPADVSKAIDQAYANIRMFHAAQAETKPMVVETMPGVVCTRFARPIDRVGIYVPGGTAILPSTALMLGVPAQVAGCGTIVLATPPRKDGTVSPEVLYVADLVGASVILKAGGAQAVAAMAYGTDEVPKVDKIFGPGNQWVTAAKMVVQNDTNALVGIDMPAGPSEVMVIADETANPVFVASDLLSQAEHGIDSQVVLVAISLPDKLLQDIEVEVDRQANALPRVDIIKQAIAKSLIVKVDSLDEGMTFSNEYAPEHLILHLADSPGAVAKVNNAGSVFVGAFSPESCGDYASGTNHTLPTYGYARQFSGVNTLSFQKHITSQELTKEGLAVLGPVVVRLAEREGLEGHANAVRVRLAEMA